MRGNLYVSILLGILAASLLGLTTDQILQNVYDSTHTALRANIVTGGSSGTVTSTGTAGHLAVLDSATNITNYAGAACATPGLVKSIGVDGSVACNTPVPTATIVSTPTPRATDTPAPTATPAPTTTPPGALSGVTTLSYSSALNVTGVTAISASATPKAADRIIDCTSGSSADQTYTLPAASGGGRIIDVYKVDSGSKNCVIGRSGSDAINSGTSRTLSAQWKHDTCRDQASAQWVCVGDGT